MRARHVAIAGLAALALAAPAAHSGPLPPLPPPPQLPFNVPFPALGTYNGGIFPSEALLAQGLSCNLADAGLSCFDTPAQAMAAGPTQPRVGARCHPALRIWVNPDRKKPSQLAMYHSGYWQDLPSSLQNSVSAFATGCDLPARFADLPAGGGAHLERPPRTAGNMPPGWDDRVDSIYRG